MRISTLLLLIDEGKAAPEGTEVTRKDGRVFKKLSGKWVYQPQKSKGGAGGAGAAGGTPAVASSAPKPPKTPKPTKVKAPPPSELEKILKGRQPKNYEERMEIFPVYGAQKTNLEASVSCDVFREIMNSDGIASKADFRAALEKRFPSYGPAEIDYLYNAAGLMELGLNGNTHLTHHKLYNSIMGDIAKRYVPKFAKVVADALDAGKNFKGSHTRVGIEDITAAFGARGLNKSDLSELMMYIVPGDRSQKWRGKFRRIFDENYRLVAIEEMTPAAWKTVKKEFDEKEKAKKVAAAKQAKYEAAWKKHMDTPAFKKRVSKFKADEEKRAKTLKVPTFKHLDEAHLWASSKHPHIEWDFKGAHLDAIQPTLQRFHLLADQWPDIAQKMTYVGTYMSGKPSKSTSQNGPEYWDLPDSIEYAHASMTYIGFNPKYYSDIKKSEESLEEGEKQGWNPKGANTIDYVLTHEFGHSVKFGLERMYSRSVTPHMAYGKKTLISNIIAAFVDHHKASDKLSKYAMKNEEEAWAESFAAIHHSPPEQWTPYTAAHFELLTALGDLMSKFSGSATAPTSPAQMKAAARAVAKIERLTGISLDIS
jgi:hypothetical protein